MLTDLKFKEGEVGINSLGFCDLPNQNHPDHLIRFGKVRLCITWLESTFESSDRPYKHDSYRLKHNVEEYWQSYICNGELIKAAICLGFRVVPKGLNAIIYMKPKRFKRKRIVLEVPEHLGGK